MSEEGGDAPGIKELLNTMRSADLSLFREAVTGVVLSCYPKLGVAQFIPRAYPQSVAQEGSPLLPSVLLSRPSYPKSRRCPSV